MKKIILFSACSSRVRCADQSLPCCAVNVVACVAVFLPSYIYRRAEPRRWSTGACARRPPETPPVADLIRFAAVIIHIDERDYR